MPDRGHASAQHHDPQDAPVQLTPDGGASAHGTPSMGGAATDIGRGAPGAVASVFSHFADDGGAQSGRVVQKKEALPAGQQGFDKMWEAHPHNYQTDESKNTSSEDLLEREGLPDWIGNTCAVRLSTMLNGSGHEITPAKVAAAGIQRKPTFSKKTGHYYILAASEMWTYLTKNFRKPDVIFPPKGIYKDAEEFQAAFDSEIRPLVAARKGIVAFETIFGYGGTGHVDLFDGEGLSDSGSWYPSKRLHLWYTVVP